MPTTPSDNRQLQRIPPAERREASNFTLAVVMAGIMAFFIAGIASAFIYAKDTNPVREATTSPGTAAVYDKAQPETTGSGAVK